MSITTRRTVLKRIGALAALPFARATIAQAGYPNKPIKIVAPVQPGGGVDLTARTVAEQLGRAGSRSSSRTFPAAAA